MTIGLKINDPALNERIRNTPRERHQASLVIVSALPREDARLMLEMLGLK